MATIAGRYEIAATIGQGGMGVVFRAYDPAPLNRHVAVKTLHESDPVALELFYKEISNLKSLTHPNIVEIFDMGEYEEGGQRKPFFVMPLLQGQTLEELIRTSRHHLTIGRVIDIFAQTCRGLQAAHDHGLIHRDLKPSNIFVMRDDSVKIIDFGIAHATSAQSRTREFKKGTLAYMSPEQLDLKPASAQSDIYSLGVTLWETLTRTPAFRGTTEEEVIKAIRTKMPAPASELNPAVPQVISRVVHKAMAKPPWVRYDSARDFGDILQKAGRAEPIDLFDPSRTQPRLQTARRALERGDYQFALEIVNELEAEGNIDPELALLRSEIEKVVRQKTIGQLLESARARFEEGEDPLALAKLHELLQLDPTNMAALALKSRIEDRRGQIQMEKWIQLARQHMDHHAYGLAREALQNALVLRPKDPGVSKLLKEIEVAEQDFLRLCREKEELYQAARNAWQNGEVSHALSRMRAVLALEDKAPDTVTSSTYHTFYEKLRTEADAISNGYAEARRHLSEQRFDAALKICDDFLTRFPGQAGFQLLQFDIEEQQRQQRSAYIADIDDRLKHEPDLDAKVSLLREALTQYPDEEHFKVQVKFFESRRDYYKAIWERARTHEADGDFAAALADLDALDPVRVAFPGLALERERLRKRLEEQTRDAALAAWIRKIDVQLESGNYPRADELLVVALAEFPGHGELTGRQRLAQDGRDRTRRADELVAEGKQLCVAGDFDRGIELLRAAQQLDDRSTTRQLLRDLFVARAQERLNEDWRTALSCSEHALEVDPHHAVARTLRAQALDRKREEETAQCLAEAGRLQADFDIKGALVHINKGLASFPADPRLIAAAAALRQELARRPPTTRSIEDTSDELVPANTAATPAPPIVGARSDSVPVHAPPSPPAETERPDSSTNRWLSRPVLLASAAVALVAIAGLVISFNRSPEQVQPPVVNPPTAPPAEPVPSTLALQGLPPGLQVSLDDTPIGSVDQTGALSYARVRPGRHVLLFTLPGYEPFTTEGEFTAGQTLTLSTSEVPLTPLSSAVEFVANQGTAITISQSGRAIERVNGSGKVSIPEGMYDIATKGPAGVETTRRLRVTAGANRIIDVRAFVVTGMEQFDQAGWNQEKGWYRRRGGGIILYNQPIPTGRYVYTVSRSPNNLFSDGARLKWAIGYIDGGTHVRFELDKNRLTRADLVNGRAVTMAQIAHRIPDNVPFLHLTAQISGNRLIQRYSLNGRDWSLLDDWTRTLAAGVRERGRRTALDGRFGLMLQDGEDVSLSNFLFHPDSR